MGAGLRVAVRSIDGAIPRYAGATAFLSAARIVGAVPVVRLVAFWLRRAGPVTTTMEHRGGQVSVPK
jgi:hypothetical protein